MPYSRILGIANWVRSIGPGDQRDLVEVYVYGPTDRDDEGIPGHDVRVRPTSLGRGDYTMVVSPDAIEETDPLADAQHAHDSMLQAE